MRKLSHFPKKWAIYVMLVLNLFVFFSLYVSSPAYLIFCVSPFLRVSHVVLCLVLFVSRVLFSNVLYVSYLMCLISCVSRVICVSCPLCFLSFVSRGMSLSVSCVSLSCVTRVLILGVLCLYVSYVSYPVFLAFSMSCVL
jgi:hypothetical protein